MVTDQIVKAARHWNLVQVMKCCIILLFHHGSAIPISDALTHSSNNPLSCPQASSSLRQMEIFSICTILQNYMHPIWLRDGCVKLCEVYLSEALQIAGYLS